MNTVGDEGVRLLTAVRSVLCAVLILPVCGHPAEFDVKQFLSLNGPLKPHEARPHGVPSSYDWYWASIGPMLTPPNGETMANAWGQIFFDESFDEARVGEVRGRIEIGRTSLWILYDDTAGWARIQSSEVIDGGSWTEDFHGYCGAINRAFDSSGLYSTAIDSPGCNVHYWPDAAHAPVRVGHVAAMMSLSPVRLVELGPSSADTLLAGHFIGSVGVDWRIPGGGCPTPSGSTVPICAGVGVGRFIRISPPWRMAAYVTLDSFQLNGVVLPPREAFLLPDGLYPDSATETPSTPVMPVAGRTSGPLLTVRGTGGGLVASVAGTGPHTLTLYDVRGVAACRFSGSGFARHEAFRRLTASGVYLLLLEAGGKRVSAKAVFIR